MIDHSTTGPRISCSTATFSHLPLATALGIIRDAGFDGAEIVAGPETVARGLAATVRTVARSGLAALTFHPPLYRFPGWPRGPVAGMLAVVAATRDLGATVGVIHAPQSRRFDTPRARRYQDGIALARAAADQAGVHIGLETTQCPWDGRPPLLFDDLGYFLDFAAAHDLGVTLDTCHAGASGRDLVADQQQIGPRLRNIHYSDWRAAPPGQKPATHLLPGAAHADELAAFTRRLAATGYAGIITLEVGPQASGWLPTRATVRRLAAARAFIAQNLAAGME